MKELNDFKKKVINEFSKEITDRVFLMIQNDKELMKEYLLLIEKGNSLTYINSEIAKEIKRKFSLKNLNEKNSNPKSTLIQGHEIFETK